MRTLDHAEGRYSDVGCYKYKHPEEKVELVAIKKLKDIEDDEQQRLEEDYLTGEINLYRKVSKCGSTFLHYAEERDRK